ncbi:hypothetical protein AAP_05046 [Ascosphaera apis ARSEF 7405]|uniref:Uncharacterized protein n=1 Tax=Ascosphaera apis ARSEF 7405 TaxID=392613 RepID=A0A167VZK7_9EURO|nr:hypothetical protein AAP_05046 [Ascosphaera apis ARSEF 7405]
MHGFIEHKYLVDRGLERLSNRFLLEGSELSINWPAVASFVIYSSIFIIVYPITFTFSILIDILYYVPLLLFYLIKTGLKVIYWPISWLAIFEPLYIYLSFAILIGLFAGLILYGISEVIQACLDKVSTYFGASVPLYRRTGPTAAAQTSLLMMKQKSSEFGDSYIHDWMDIGDEHWAMGSGLGSGSGSGSGSGTGTDYYHPRRTDGTSEEEEEDETRRRRNLQAKKSRVLWRSPPAWELALFPLSRMEELDRDEPNYDSEEEEGE